MIDPSLALALAVHTTKGAYALLLGSGISRSASIPTGWEVVLDIIRKLAHLQQADCAPDPADWYVRTYNEQPDYARLLDQLAHTPTAGDTLTVWRLDRLGRSLKHLIEMISQLQERGIGFLSVQENIDTTTSGGKLIFHVFGALAEFERDLIRERTQAGLQAARARGRRGGRPRAAALNDPKKAAIAQSLYDDPDNSIADICATLRISRSTLYRAIQILSHRR